MANKYGFYAYSEGFVWIIEEKYKEYFNHIYESDETVKGATK